MENKERIYRTFKGTVVSDAMDKTIVVRVDTLKMHKKYKKQYKTSQRFKVHDEKNAFSVGDVVTFVECRPLSKEKRWRVIY
jgi:small subunit ribosomal protein S17